MAFSGKAGQLGQEFMSGLGEDSLGLVLIRDSHHAARIEARKVGMDWRRQMKMYCAWRATIDFSINSPRRSAMAIASR